MKKGIIVSIQGYGKGTTDELAKEAINAGAVALRVDKKVNHDVPQIGLLKSKNKDHFSQPYITYTIEDVKSVSTWADYVAIDYRRINPFLQEISDYCLNQKVKIIADVASIYDVYNIFEKGYHYDFLATTLSVFGRNSPDFWLLKEILKIEPNTIAEGNFKSLEHVKRAAKSGAHAVCIGEAITGVYKKTKQFGRAFDVRENK
jgi:N-acylglucosamine-6-phosphate 2-epimerase